MEFTLVYTLGLAILFALACVALFFSFKKFRRESGTTASSSMVQEEAGLTRKQEISQWLEHWFADFSGELVGAFIGTLIFGLLVTLAQSAQQENNEKTRLIIQMGSESADITLSASEELLARGWMRDGTLRNSSFIGANLRGRFLKGADFEGSMLNWADLRGASLMYSNLENANLFNADLCGAMLLGATMQNASLMSADLRESGLTEANLKGVDLFQSDLRGATFRFTAFDENTTLPNGTRVDPNVSIEEQLDVFTNPKNPGFIPIYDKNDPYKSTENPDCKKFRPTDLPR